MTSSKASPDGLTIDTRNVKVTVKEGRNPLPFITVGIVVVILAVIIALNVTHVERLTEETYFVNETVQQVIPGNEDIIVQRTVERTETYVEQEWYVPKRNFTTVECMPEPLAFSYEVFGDFGTPEFDVQTKTGYDTDRGTYVIGVRICNDETRVTSDELAVAGKPINRDEDINYRFCNNANGTAQECFDYALTVAPGICTTRTYSWTTPFHSSKDISLDHIRTTSTREVCGKVTREIPIDEFERQLGDWQPDKNYTVARNITKTRTVIEYVNETVQNDTSFQTTIVREIPRTRAVVTRITLWRALFA